MTATYLLDASALIALTLTDHEHHQRAAFWAAGVHQMALCPVVEGSLVRFLVHLGQSQATAKAILDGLYSSPRCEFWPDAISYRQADLGHVVGHRQVTDAYLSALAASNGGLLATFDQALAQEASQHVVLIP